MGLRDTPLTQNSRSPNPHHDQSLSFLLTSLNSFSMIHRRPRRISLIGGVGDSWGLRTVSHLNNSRMIRNLELGPRSIQLPPFFSNDKDTLFPKPPVNYYGKTRTQKGEYEEVFSIQVVPLVYFCLLSMEVLVILCRCSDTIVSHCVPFDYLRILRHFLSCPHTS